MSAPIVLYVGDPIAFAHDDWARFRKSFDILFHGPSTPEEFISALKPGGKYDSIQAIVRPSNPAAELDIGPFTKDLIAHLPPTLKIISSINHGYEKEDVAELGRKGILYCNGAGGGESGLLQYRSWIHPKLMIKLSADDSTADIAAYLLIGAFRYTSYFERMLRGISAEGHYRGNPQTVGHSEFFLKKLESSKYNSTGNAAMAAADNPAGKLLGIIGMGNVGLACAKRGVALGMTIHYFGRSRKSPQIEALLGGATFHTELNKMLQVVDCVLLACPYSSATHHILGKEAFSVMKRGMRVVNVGRGRCIDEAALAEALEDGTVSGVGLDVFYNEYVVTCCA